MDGPTCGAVLERHRQAAADGTMDALAAQVVPCPGAQAKWCVGGSEDLDPYMSVPGVCEDLHAGVWSRLGLQEKRGSRLLLLPMLAYSPHIAAKAHV